MSKLHSILLFTLLTSLSFAAQSNDGKGKVLVTAENFARAESDMYFSNIVKNNGFSKYYHTREVTPIDQQNIIRLNRDTLYSAAVFDLDAGSVTIELPESNNRFISMQIIDENQYTHGVYYDSGKYVLDKKDIGTRYVAAPIRILVNPNDPNDIREAHKIQDEIKISQKSRGEFIIPEWDVVSQNKVRNALLTLGSTLTDTRRMYGDKEHVDPVRFLIGSAIGWGANPEKEALYLNVTPPLNDGKTIYKLNVNKVPVDGFWSISVYNKAGFYEKNKENSYTLNNITSKKGSDGSVNIQFGGCTKYISNCIPIMDGWNYMVRLYRPSEDVLSGKWRFPEAIPFNK
ncbi:DUF1254 domain-containing protein [Enterobacter kobei]|uniref:DUF1254 domain-containing protein n=1 Tax=Enterobacter kobei TaxID=208224 RepID=UPI00235F1B31|nr:DUF1254 domain-containing protein [Enterobacter kobei]